MSTQQHIMHRNPKAHLSLHHQWQVSQLMMTHILCWNLLTLHPVLADSSTVTFCRRDNGDGCCNRDAIV